MNTSIDLLKSYNLTATPQRLEIVNVLSSYGHLNVDKLYALLKSTFPSISLATVYKNINTMMAKNFLSEVKLQNQKSVYELVKETHSHIMCTECEEILDITLDTSSLFAEATSKSNYNITSSNIVFNGVCQKCQVL